VAVEQGDPQKVQLQDHEHVKREGTAKFGIPVTGHEALFYWEMGKERVKY
jgi:hypothetical protein